MRFKDYALPAAAISMIFVMLVPVPAAVLDLLLALSMAASMIVFLSAVQIRRAVELSVFPTLLLLLTLFRLSLNIASSRRILLHGQEGTAAAGKVIEAFGQFVVGGNYVVGFVLFLALIAIQFLVVSHGAVRTAEVTARFTLDALPGKQMAIDADMNAGLIDEAEARRRRQAIAREAEFYGAMDGAARFNQRDSLATILITAINIVAGLLIGTLQQGVGLAEAARTYTTLTVGDGLVTIIPSLLVSVAGGITLTRANSAGLLGGEIRQQLLARPSTLFLASIVCAAMCLIPGLPKVVFLAVSAGLFVAGRRVAAVAAAAAVADAPAESKKAAQAPAAEMAALLKLEDLTLEIGFQLIPLVDEKQGGQLLNRIRTLRRNLSSELGFMIPPVHISDNLRLKPREYVFSLRGLEIGRWQTQGAQLLAVSGEPGRRPLAGRETREPAFGVPAIWIQPAIEEQAVAAGYSVVDATTVITTHLGELIRQHAWELVGRAEIKRLMDALNDSHPKLIEELVPKLLTLGEVGRVLEQLLRERVSIRDLGSVLEALLETAGVNKGLEALV
ncbi:MAG: flagellar biosynthesis protein FlhA, partial [Terracidiphilus sp.]